MAVEVASAYVTLMPSMKGFQGRLNKELRGTNTGEATKAGKKQGGAMGAAMGGAAGGMLKKAIAPLAAIGGAAAGASFFKGAISQASDLNESFNALEVVYGKNAEGIKQLGREAADAMGLSNVEFNNSAVQFSAFTQTIAGEGGDVVGTLKDLTTRGSDFASVMNLEVNEAMGLFQSGLAGETEPLRKYGIDLSAAAVEQYALANGIASSASEMTENEKVQARYGLLMEKTAQTSGDFANTSDSLANSQRIVKANFENLQASIGAAFLPVLEKMTGYLAGTVLPAVTGLVEGMRDGTGAGGRIAEVFGTVKGAAETAFGYVRDFVSPILADLSARFESGTESGDILRVAFDRILEAGRVAFTWFQDEGLPALQAVWGFITKTLAPDVTSAFYDRIKPALVEIGNVVRAFWEVWAKPALTALWAFIRDILGPFIVSFYEDGIKPTFDLIGKAISGAWNNVIKPIFNRWVETMENAPKQFRKAKDVMSAIWDNITDKTSTAWGAIKGVFDKFKDGINSICSTFERAASGIGTAWTKIQQFVAKPIVAVIRFVNDGIIDSLNKVLKWAGVGTIGRIPIPNNLARAAAGYGPVSVTGGPNVAMAGGGVLPGYSPGKDNLFFKGNKFDLALAGGEAIMRPEWTRAVGKDFIDSMNATARTGGVGGVRKALGFRSGGVLPMGGDEDGGLPKWLTGLFSSAPIRWLRERFSGVMDTLKGNPLFGMVSGFVNKAITGIKDKLLNSAGGGNASNGGVNYGGPYGWNPNAGRGSWPAIWRDIQRVAPEAVMTSNYRPGAITASGVPSLHGQGRAVDVVSPNMAATFRKIRNLRKWSQLFYTPMGNLQVGYRDAIIAATHRDHIHAGYDKGGIIPDLYDQGGWLQPGVSLVSNKTGKPEAVFTEDQMARLGNGGDTQINVYGVPMDVAGKTADEILYQMRRTGRGKYTSRR